MNESATKFLEELKKEELEIYKDSKFKEIEKQFENSFKPYKIIQTKVIHSIKLFFCKISIGRIRSYQSEHIEKLIKNCLIFFQSKHFHFVLS